MKMERTELTFNIESLAWAGFLPPNGNNITKKQVLWFCFSLIQCLVMNVLIFWNFATNEFSMLVATDFVTCSINLFQTLFLRYYFTSKINKISSLVELFNAMPEHNSPPFATAEREMRSSSLQKIKNFSRLIFFFNAAVALLTILQVTFANAVKGLGCSLKEGCDSGHALLFEIWWPGDPSKGVVYYVIMAWQAATLLTNISSVATTDAFACALSLAVSERSSLLARNAPRALLPGRDQGVTPHCRAWLRYHQYYIKIVADLNEVMGPVFFTTYIVASVNIIALSYVSVKVSNAGVLAGSIAILTVLLVRLFTFAYAGQCIITKSEELARNSLSAAQVAKGSLRNGPVRTTLLVLVTRLTGGIKPEEISGLGYFAISMEFFTKILSVSVSYLVILLQLR